jgi:hypothetical protein
MTIQRDSHGSPYWWYPIYLRRGLIEGWSAFDKFGFNSDLDTGVEETIRQQGGLFTTPNSIGYPLRITTTNAQDDFATGTGAKTLQITGVGSGWVEQTKTYNLTGNDTVVTSDLWLGVNRTVVFLAGSNHSAVGEINGSVYTDTTSINLFHIAAGESIDNSCMYWVPKGKTAYVDLFQSQGVRLNGGSSPIIEFKLNTFTTTTNATYTYYRVEMDTDIANILTEDRTYSEGVPEKSVIYANGKSNKDNTFAYAQMDLTIITN